MLTGRCHGPSGIEPGNPISFVHKEYSWALGISEVSWEGMRENSVPGEDAG